MRLSFMPTDLLPHSGFVSSYSCTSTQDIRQKEEKTRQPPPLFCQKTKSIFSDILLIGESIVLSHQLNFLILILKRLKSSCQPKVTMCHPHRSRIPRGMGKFHRTMGMKKPRQAISPTTFAPMLSFIIKSRC